MSEKTITQTVVVLVCDDCGKGIERSAFRKDECQMCGRHLCFSCRQKGASTPYESIRRNPWFPVETNPFFCEACWGARGGWYEEIQQAGRDYATREAAAIAAWKKNAGVPEEAE